MNSYRQYSHPRFWGTWCLLFLMQVVTFLPYKWQLKAGRLLGRIFLYFAPYRRHVTQTNLALCFPELNMQEQQMLLKRTFESVGMGIIEMGAAWFGNEKQLENTVIWRGEEYLQQAIDRNESIILIGAHFTCLEIAAKLFAQKFKFRLLYRPHKNKLFNQVMVNSRERYVEKTIPRQDMRELLRSVNQKIPVWYAPDQDYGKDYSVFAHFFGKPAATITGLARLAKRTGATVIPVIYHRLPDHSGYEIILHPPFENFPVGDDIADAQRFNDLLESDLRKHPEQYLWQHRRFKTRPPGEKKLYQKKRKRS